MRKPLLSIFAILLLSILANAQNPVIVAGAASKRPSQSGNETSKAFDGDPATMYHSDWSLNAMPDTVDFYFIGAKSIDKIAYTPRQTQTNGIWTTVEVYYATTDAPAVFVSKLSNISWPLTNAVKTIDMTASPIVKPAIVRLVIRAAGGNFSSCAEINFSSAETGTLATAADCDSPTAEDFSAYAAVKANISSASVSPAANGGEDISRTYDNNTSTLYHSSYAGGGFPISLTYNFTDNPTIDYINYIPRPSGDNGLFGAGEIWYTTTTVTTLTKLMDFNAGFNSSLYQISFPAALTNVTQIVVKVLSGKNNFASCAEMQFYRQNGGGGNLYTDIFADDLYTILRPGITQADINAITSPFFKSLAQCLFNNTYNKKYRFQAYDFYPNPGTVEGILKSNGLNRFENPTGIAFKANTKAIVFVGDTYGVNPTLVVKDFALDDNATTDTYPLQKGMNVINMVHDGLGYIGYFSNNTNLQPVQINIVSGSVNSYYNPLTNTDNEWTQMLLNGVYPKLDIKGTYANLNINKSALINNSVSGGKDLVAAYDTIVYTEYILNGLVKYNRVPKNHMFVKVAIGGGYYAGGDGIHLDLGWGEAGITNGKAILNNPWGIPHEFGHNNQVRPGAKWVGMTEVTNNINSAWIQYIHNKVYPNATRLEKENGTPKSGVAALMGGIYGSLFDNCLVQKKHIEAQDDVFVRLLPFWQLELYYQLAGASKNWPTMAQRLSGMPAPVGEPDVAFWYGDVLEKMRTTSQSGINNGQLSLNFVSAVCDAVQEDLTDFFVKGGYLLPIDRDIDDYGVQHMTITQTQIDALIADIQAKGYPKPVSPVLNYISANSVSTYKNRVPLTGTTMVGVTVNATTLTIDNTKWANAVAFETFNQKVLTDVAIYGTGDATTANSKTTVQFGDASTSVYAVGYDGKRILVYPAIDPANALPVRLLSFMAQNIENRDVLLKWKVTDEVNFSRYEIERAGDQRLFRTIGSLNRNELSAYTFTDESPLKGTGYYRLKMVDNDDTFNYSPIKAVHVSSGINFIINSNPSENGILNFRMEGLENPSPLTLSVTTASGRILKTERFDNIRNNMVYTTALGGTGVYIVQARLANGQKFTTKIMVAK